MEARALGRRRVPRNRGSPLGSLERDPHAGCWPEFLLRVHYILYFASFAVCATINLAMRALIFMGGLWAVLAGTDAIACNPGDQCAVCESCKRFVCKVLR